MDKGYRADVTGRERPVLPKSALLRRGLAPGKVDFPIGVGAMGHYV